MGELVARTDHELGERVARLKLGAAFTGLVLCGDGWSGAYGWSRRGRRVVAVAVLAFDHQGNVNADTRLGRQALAQQIA